MDVVAEKHRPEMLKTIGDAYMCAGGVPEPNRTRPVDARLPALEMQAEMASSIATASGFYCRAGALASAFTPDR